MGPGKWIGIIGAIISIIGQFIWSDYYLPLLGGLIALIGIVIITEEGEKDDIQN